MASPHSITTCPPRHEPSSPLPVDKQFTALAVMLLVEEHKVSLDEPIGRYLAEVPASWNEIRVRHLLTHTSGLGDAAQEVAGGPRVYTRYTTRDLVEGNHSNFREVSLRVSP